MLARECENLDQNAVMDTKWVSRHLDIGILFNTTQKTWTGEYAADEKSIIYFLEYCEL